MVISELHNSVYSSRRNQKNLISGRTDLMTPQNSSWHPRQEKCSKEAKSRGSKRPNGETAEKLTPWGSSQSYVFRKAAWWYSGLEAQHSKLEPSFLLVLCAELTRNSQPVPLRTPLQSKTVYNCALLFLCPGHWREAEQIAEPSSASPGCSW